MKPIVTQAGPCGIVLPNFGAVVRSCRTAIRSVLEVLGLPIILAVVLVGSVNNARADTLVDPLNDWWHTAGHNDVATLDTTSPEFFKGDLSRAKCDGGNLATFYYHLGNISNFSLKIFYFNHMDEIDVYVSPDNVQWYPVSTALSQAQETQAYWNYAVLKPTTAIGRGINYIGFSVHSGEKMFSPQIGEVSIDYLPPMSRVPAPTGVNVIAASGEAYLNWFPVAGAKSYNVLRRSGSVLEFSTVATEVHALNYMDHGLKTNGTYHYAISANCEDGVTAPSNEADATPDSGSVLFTDPLTDWSGVAQHTDKIGFSTSNESVPVVKRLDSTMQSFTYNLPGLVKFAMNVYYTGEPKGQFFVDASSDGSTWTPVPITHSAAIEVSPNWWVAVFTPTDKMPPRSNYVRFSLNGEEHPESPQLGQARLRYGSSSDTPAPKMGPATIVKASKKHAKPSDNTAKTDAVGE